MREKGLPFDSGSYNGERTPTYRPTSVRDWRNEEVDGSRPQTYNSADYGVPRSGRKVECQGRGLRAHNPDPPPPGQRKGPLTTRGTTRSWGPGPTSRRDTDLHRRCAGHRPCS